MLEEVQYHWSKVQSIIKGPDLSAYADRSFSVEFQLETLTQPYYPLTAPTIRFMTPIFHPNVTDLGLLDYDQFSPDNWSSSTTLHDILMTIHELLKFPAIDRTYQPV